MTSRAKMNFCATPEEKCWWQREIKFCIEFNHRSQLNFLGCCCGGDFFIAHHVLGQEWHRAQIWWTRYLEQSKMVFHQKNHPLITKYVEESRLRKETERRPCPRHSRLENPFSHWRKQKKKDLHFPCRWDEDEVLQKSTRKSCSGFEITFHSGRFEFHISYMKFI